MRPASSKKYDTSIFVSRVTSLSKLKDGISDKFYRENNLTKYEKYTEIIKNDFYLKNNEIHKTAVAVFKIPNQQEIIPLTEEQCRIVSESFKVYKVEKIDDHYAIMFDYENEAILPQNREQATLVLLTPHLKDDFSTSSQVDRRSLEILNSAQKQAFEKDILCKKEEAAELRDKQLNLQTFNSLHIISQNKEVAAELPFINKTVDHYLNLILKSNNFNQKILFANVIALITEKISSIDSFSKLEKISFSNSATLSEKTIYSALQILETIDYTNLGNLVTNADIQNNEMSALSYLLADLELKTIFTDDKDFRNAIKEWEQQVEQSLYNSNTLNEGSFAGISFEQVLTLANDAYLRGIQREYHDAVFNEQLKADIELLSLIGNDFSLDVIQDHEKLYKRFINTTFKSDVLDNHGRIRTIESYSQTLDQQFHQIRIKAEQEGFATGTFVKTDGNYQRIEDIQSGQLVTSYDIRNKNQTERKVVNVCKESVERYIQITLNNTVFNAAFDQKFYIPSKNTWVTAYELSESKDLQQHFPSKIIDIKAVLEQADICKITVEIDHNYYVTKNDLLTHNFVPLAIGATYVFGAGVSFTVTIVAPIIIGWLAKTFSRKDKPVNIGQSNNSMPSPQMPEDPDKKNDDWKKVKEQWQPLTNKKAREIADKKGYKEANPEFNTHGQIAFQNKKGEWISPDKDGHNGGNWKMFDKSGKLLFSYNIHLDKIVKIYK